MKSKPEGNEPGEPLEAAEPLPGIEYATPDERLKPLFLLADSQLLFWKDEDGTSFVRTVRDRLDTLEPSAAYIGASNGDDPAFYSIFEAAMEEAGIEERRMIRSELEADDLDFVDRASWILLAGGDVVLGWQTFKQNGLSQILTRRYYEGALLMGISAGAIQLGLGTVEAEGVEAVETFRLIPHWIGAHDEARGWPTLKAALGEKGGHSRAYGIPTGGGFAYHPDHAIEPLRRPLVELTLKGGQVAESMIMPGAGGEAEELDEDLVSDSERGPVN